MSTVSVREMRKRLSDLLDTVGRGESVVITRRGREVARLVPPAAKSKGLPDLSAFRKSIRLKGKGLSKTVVEMRGEERF